MKPETCFPATAVARRRLADGRTRRFAVPGQACSMTDQAREPNAEFCPDVRFRILLNFSSEPTKIGATLIPSPRDDW